MRRLGVLVALLALAACDSTVSPPNAAVLIPGDAETMLDASVTYLEIEGGAWVLRDATGQFYEPTNLPGDYRVEGLEVRAEVDVLEGYASILQVGPIVQIRQIAPR